MIRQLLLPVVLVATAGCATPASPPATAATQRASGPFATTAATSIAPLPDDWWHLYASPELDALVRASLAANGDLRVAYANLDASRATLSIARAARLPQVTLESGLKVDHTSLQPSAATVPSTDWDMALTASWDADLFGRLRQGALAAHADNEAQQAALDGLKVAVAADTVLAYFELCTAEQALIRARDVVSAGERLADLVRKQLAAGEVSPLELSQATTLAASSRAAIPPYEALRSAARFRLATLQGRTPAEGPSPAPTCKEPPKLAAPLPVGDGSALLLRRPDLREAERRLAAASARVGVARADLYPRINLGGAVGILAGSFDAVATPLLTWVFPFASPARAKLEQARAGEQAVLAGWDVAILKALREVETTLSAYDAEMRRNQELQVAEKEAVEFVRRADARVRLGDAASLVRFDAERTLATARLLRSDSDLALARSQVALFRSLGGGWNVPEAAR